MADPVLTVPSTAGLLPQAMLEAGNFMATVEDASLPPSIVQSIQLASQTEATNRAPSILVTIDQIKGTVAAGGISNAIEVYGWHIAGRRKSVEGADGQLQATGQVILTDLLIVCPDDSFVETSIQAAFDGQNIGKLALTFLRNVGDTAKPDFQINLTNCRLSYLLETEVVTTLGIGFDTIKIVYFPIGVDAKASGQVAAGFNLTTNAPVK